MAMLVYLLRLLVWSRLKLPFNWKGTFVVPKSMNLNVLYKGLTTFGLITMQFYYFLVIFGYPLTYYLAYPVMCPKLWFI